MKTQKIKETYCFIHKDIKIYVRIDYLNNNISIVEPVCLQEAKFKKKEWCFIGRGVEYMKGWRDILEAISEATKDAQKRYEADLAENSKFAREEGEKLMIALDEAMIKSVKGRNKKLK